MSNRAAFVEEAKGQIVVRETEIREPGAGEVLIKVFACAIQPADAKIAKTAMIPMEYPSILGSPIAGTVEALGSGVSKVSIGERVVCGTKVIKQKSARYGGLQRYSVVDEAEVLEIGDVPFTTAVTLASYTPPGALFSPSKLAMSFPNIPASPLLSTEQGKKILIWGGSSAMGSLSISYAKAAGYTVISTSSPHNFQILKYCGADHIFDHSDPDTVGMIEKLMPIDYWFDTISLRPSLEAIIQILTPKKGEAAPKAHILTLLPLVMSGMRLDEFPEGVTTAFHLFSTSAPENKEWADHFLKRGGLIEKAIKEGVLKGVPADVLGGLDSVGKGIEMVYGGVSGKKVVIEPWA